MKSIALLSALMVVSFISCTNRKDAKTNTSTAEYDTVKTDSGVSIIKDKTGKIVATVPTKSLTHGGSTQLPGQAAPIPGKDSTSNINAAPITHAFPFYVGGVLIHGEGGNITLDELGVGNNIKPLYVQAANSEGRFGFQGSCDGPELMQLRLPNGNIQFVALPNDSIDFTIVLEDPKDYKVYGSVESLQLENVFNILNDANAKKVVIDDKLKNAGNDRALYVQMMSNRVKQYNAIDEEKRAALMKFITQIDTSYVAILASVYLNPVEDFEFLKNLDNKMKNRYANAPFYKSLHSKVATYLPVDIGKIAPDFTSQTPDGKTFELSSLKGKVTLLDFWVSYNPKSREENPHYEKLYKKYKDKGLSIVSYSLDKQKGAWVQAIGDDHMKWINVSDLKGYGNGGAKTYVISDVPYNFLIDRSGRIVAKNIYGKELDKKIEQLIH